LRGPSRDYAAFRETLRHPSAQPALEEMLDFVQGFPGGLPRAEAARRVHRFLTGVQDRVLSEIDVFAADGDEEARANTMEGLEKFLLGRLHQRLFASEPADAAEDARLQRRIGSLRWVECKHLGVPAVNPALLFLAVKELQRIDRYKAPRDKLVCVRNACHVIGNVLIQTRAESGVVVRPLSADDFLPMLIFALIMANPPRLHSNVEFVAAFRHPSRLVAEDAYYLTTLQSAVAFVGDAGPKALDVTPEDFDRLCAASLREHRAASGHAEAAELGAAGRRRLGQRVEALPLRFEAVHSAQQLRVQDLDALLEEYREMAQLLHDVSEGALGQ